ncbi:hypothetical protein BDV96DRAFT_259698 [Lophiotrema nucula]|uniref:Secreted protein n=1 Tax=Lophiotrema nucula TaxID=690887 RepID=A0A6A5YRH2_9PLEO|nr:hypothetical protein BDV96DRAFT_259698 [Lophiotrema nucula]
MHCAFISTFAFALLGTLAHARTVRPALTEGTSSCWFSAAECTGCDCHGSLEHATVLQPRNRTLSSLYLYHGALLKIHASHARLRAPWKD